MKLMTASTSGGGVRDEIFGWGHEDTDLFVRGKPIGFTPSPITGPFPETILEALCDGWKLLGPPTKYTEGEETWWEWWLTKESKA